MLGQSLEKAQSFMSRPLILKFFVKSKNEPAFLGLSKKFSTRNFFVSTSFCGPEFSEFAHTCDTMTLESEFFRPTILDFHQAGINLQKLVPSFSALDILTNKLEQKKLVRRLGIPTSDFFVLNKSSQQEIPQKGPWVLKWATGGYDGRGTYFLNNPTDLNTPNEHLQSFLMGSSQTRDPNIFAEKKINIRGEFALSCLRLKSNPESLFFFPLVYTEQKNGVCEWAELPVPAELKVPPNADLEIQNWMRKVCFALDYFGLLTVEVFLDVNGEIWINEWAPRVHNSLHLSREACKIDQFTAHLCALFPEPLPLKPAFFNLEPGIRVVMKNLLGKDSKDPILNRLAASESPAQLSHGGLDLFFQGYGKSQFAPGRKMGHVCVKSAIHTDREKLRNNLTDFEDSLLK